MKTTRLATCRTISRLPTSRRPASRRRADERGAALFIVVLVITLLTAIGIFAARSASLVDVASGYDRQAIQTEYIAEYGIRGATTRLANGEGSAALNEIDRKST
ncbi:MAG: PilX N-terminal domain-containing pilus assembly protein, partial [Polyangiaceae bacterium]